MARRIAALKSLEIDERLALGKRQKIFDERPIVGAQSADPITDRKVSVEVKATILK